MQKVGQAVRLVSTKDMTSEDWLKNRQRGLGGSDISAVLGVNKWKSKMELWLEKTDQVKPEQISNDAIDAGNYLEPVLRQWFMDKTKFKVQQVHSLLQHPEKEFLLANIDGLILNSGVKEYKHDEETFTLDGNGVLEIKTADRFLMDQWDGEDVPIQYMAQMQHYLSVTGLKWGAFFALIGGNRPVIKFVNRDDDLIQMMTDMSESFWYNNVIANVAPEIDGTDASKNFLGEYYRISEKGAEMEADKDLEDAFEQYWYWRNEEDSAKENKQLYENMIKDKLKETEVLKKDGLILATWKTGKPRKTFDKKTLQKDHPEIYEKYESEGQPSRSFLPKKLKGAVK